MNIILSNIFLFINVIIRCFFALKLGFFYNHIILIYDILYNFFSLYQVYFLFNLTYFIKLTILHKIRDYLSIKIFYYTILKLISYELKNIKIDYIDI